MTMTTTPDAKKHLSSTIRSLRERLLRERRDATRAASRLDIHRLRDADLDEASAARRRRLEAWLEEQERAETSPNNGAGKKSSASKKGKRSQEAFLREVEKQAAYTLLNRLVVLRLVEAPGSAGEL